MHSLKSYLTHLKMKTPLLSKNDTVDSVEEQSIHSADGKQINSAEKNNNKTHNHLNQNNEEQYLFSPETISSVLGVDLPADNFFSDLIYQTKVHLSVSI